MIKAYYNEFDPKAAAWLRQLIKNGLIMDGIVDDRSIIEVQPEDLKGFTRHHFFAGIGGWEKALELANWPVNRPVCTASLPCQPFSVAGAQKGKEDERHLLPHFIELVKQCNFQTIFGEQVPGAIKHGWLDDLCTEMERENYSVGSIVLTASGAGAPHIRQRLYWVADSTSKRAVRRPEKKHGTITGQIGIDLYEHIGSSKVSSAAAKSSTKGLQGHGRSEQKSVSPGWKRKERYDSQSSNINGLENAVSNGQCKRSEIGGGIFGQCQDWEACDQSERRSEICRLGDTEHDEHNASQIGRSISESETKSRMFELEGSDTEWSDPDWLYCRDEKYRPIKSSIEPLANGLPRGVGYSSDPSEPIDANNTQEARVMRLKGYGNAIVPQVASSFIQAFLEAYTVEDIA